MTGIACCVEESESVWKALRAYESGTADFADYLIGIQNDAHEASPTHTFDILAARSPHFKLLK